MCMLSLSLVQSVFGFGGKDPARFVKASGHPDLYYVDDPEEAVEKVRPHSLLYIPHPRLPGL